VGDGAAVAARARGGVERDAAVPELGAERGADVVARERGEEGGAAGEPGELDGGDGAAARRPA
jgi:hypothetical protein